MEDGHFIDDPLAVVGVKPDFSGIGLEKKPENAKLYAPPYKEPEDVVTCKALSLAYWRITGEASSIGVPLRFFINEEN